MWLVITFLFGANRPQHIMTTARLLLRNITYLLNLIGSTILPRFLFQKRYVSGVAC